MSFHCLVKTYYVRAFDRFARRHPLVSLDGYVDSFLITTLGKAKEVVDMPSEAVLDPTQVTEEEPGCTIEIDKSTVTVSSRAVTETARKRIGGIGGPPIQVVQFLWVDQLHGRRGILARKGKLRDLRRKAVARASRPSRLRVRYRGPTNTYSTGVIPATVGGADALGVSDADPKQPARLTIATLTPAGKARSRSGSMTARRDP